MIASRLLLAAAFGTLAAASLQSAQSPPRTASQGVYSEAQAAKGKAHYAENCAGCHMDDLSGGGPAPALTGDAFMAQNTNRTAADLFTRIKTTMPPDRPEQLDDAMYVELIAYLLREAGFPAGQTTLPLQIDALKQIEIARGKTGKELGRTLCRRAPLFSTGWPPR